MGTNRSQKYLTWIAILVMIFSICFSGFLLWYLVINRDNITLQLQNSLRNELAKYNLDSQEPLNVDEAKLAIAVAKYCETRNDCKGRDGYNGSKGDQGIEGLQGLQGIAGALGLTGPRGEQGEIGPAGPEGQPGQPGVVLEERCTVVNQDTRRIEKKYADAESWSIKYYLSPGQLCPEEVQ